MPIPEAQLATWSHQGSVNQSSTTYNSIRNVLIDSKAPYCKYPYDVFLQGSYGNDTNIYSESDVDLVILLKGTFQHDLSILSNEQISAFDNVHPVATYSQAELKEDVVKVLSNAYGASVKAGEKAITINAGGNRRKADVIPAIEYRRYHQFKNLDVQSYTEGICFYSSDGRLIVNYPKHHSANLITKNQQTGVFKAIVRIFKNIRGRLVDLGLLERNAAPSYYLEGLLYNVPANEFLASNYQAIITNVINWIYASDRSLFLCAHEQHVLFDGNSPVTWNEAQCSDFLNATIKLWNHW
jgi:hypothetical protein